MPDAQTQSCPCVPSNDPMLSDVPAPVGKTRGTLATPDKHVGDVLDLGRPESEIVDS